MIGLAPWRRELRAKRALLLVQTLRRTLTWEMSVVVAIAQCSQYSCLTDRYLLILAARLLWDAL